MHRSKWPGWLRSALRSYLDHTAIVVSIVVAVFRIDHLFSPLGTIVKQLGFACCHVVQKPVLLSFHVPPILVPDCATGSRITLPSDVKVILNLVPLGVEAMKGWPLKKVLNIGGSHWISCKSGACGEKYAWQGERSCTHGKPPTNTK